MQNKAFRLDGIPALLIKKYASELAPLLTTGSFFGPENCEYCPVGAHLKYLDFIHGYS